jgi:hypothetical protein
VAAQALFMGELRGRADLVEAAKRCSGLQTEVRAPLCARCWRPAHRTHAASSDLPLPRGRQKLLVYLPEVSLMRICDTVVKNHLKNGLVSGLFAVKS